MVSFRSQYNYFASGMIMSITRPIVIDLFAGAGGFGVGFEIAGFSVPFSLEVDAWACDTLRYNHPGMVVLQQDIRDFTTSAAIRSVCQFRPDIIIGGPPCQGFSVAGPAKKDPKDPRNSLFVNFAQWIGFLEPKAFVMENVKGMLARKNSDGQKVIDIIKNTFVELGYYVEVWLLNAAEYGVPQIRERIFIVGNKGDRELGPPPKTYSLELANRNSPQFSLFDTVGLLPAVTLWEAISDLPLLNAREGKEVQEYATEPFTEFQYWARNGSFHLYNHVAMDHSPRLVERFKHIKWGESSSDVPMQHGARRRNGNGALSGVHYDQNNRRLYPHKPSHTIAASFYANFIHPFQHRNLTAREGARIQSFPDFYRFMGKKTVVSHKLLHREERFDEKFLCQYNQIGNAVPPILASAIAVHLQEQLELCPSIDKNLLVHGSNLEQKENHRTKYRSDDNRRYLQEIRVEYDKWHTENMTLIGPVSLSSEKDEDTIRKRVKLLSAYKDFLDQQHYAEAFDSRSNLHSSVLEEFLYYLFKDLVNDFGKHALIGKSHTFKDIFFVPPSYSAMLKRPYGRIERKDHDFVIGVTIEASFEASTPPEQDKPPGEQQLMLKEEPESYGEVTIAGNIETHIFDIPAVAIECKTYLDKTMLEGSSRAAEDLKARNPNSLYIVVMEWIKLTSDVNLRKYKVDQIYVLRQQRNTDREYRYADDYIKNPLNPKVVLHLFNTVRHHLTSDWTRGLEGGIQRGWLID